MDDHNTNLIINLISLGLLILNIGLYLTIGKDLIKNKTGNTVAWVINLVLCVAAVVGFFTNSVLSISCFASYLDFNLTKAHDGKEIKGFGVP